MVLASNSILTYDQQTTNNVLGLTLETGVVQTLISDSTTQHTIATGTSRSCSSSSLQGQLINLSTSTQLIEINANSISQTEIGKVSDWSESATNGTVYETTGDFTITEANQDQIIIKHKSVTAVEALEVTANLKSVSGNSSTGPITQSLGTPALLYPRNYENNGLNYSIQINNSNSNLFSKDHFDVQLTDVISNPKTEVNLKQGKTLKIANTNTKYSVTDSVLVNFTNFQISLSTNVIKISAGQFSELGSFQLNLSNMVSQNYVLSNDPTKHEISQGTYTFTGWFKTLEDYYYKGTFKALIVGTFSFTDVMFSIGSKSVQSTIQNTVAYDIVDLDIKNTAYSLDVSTCSNQFSFTDSQSYVQTIDSVRFTDVPFTFKGTSTITGTFTVGSPSLLPIKTTVISTTPDIVFEYLGNRYSLFANKTEGFEVISQLYKEFFLPNLDREVIYENGDRNVYFSNGTNYYTSTIRERIFKDSGNQEHENLDKRIYSNTDNVQYDFNGAKIIDPNTFLFESNGTTINYLTNEKKITTSEYEINIGKELYRVKHLNTGKLYEYKWDNVKISMSTDFYTEYMNTGQIKYSLSSTENIVENLDFTQIRVVDMKTININQLSQMKSITDSSDSSMVTENYLGEKTLIGSNVETTLTWDGLTKVKSSLGVITITSASGANTLVKDTVSSITSTNQDIPPLTFSSDKVKIVISSAEHVFNLTQNTYLIDGASSKQLVLTTDLMGFKIYSNAESGAKVKYRPNNIIVRISNIIYNYDLENTNVRISKVSQPGTVEIYCHDNKKWKLQDGLLFDTSSERTVFYNQKRNYFLESNYCVFENMDFEWYAAKSKRVVKQTGLESLLFKQDSVEYTFNGNKEYSYEYLKNLVQYKVVHSLQPYVSETKLSNNYIVKEDLVLSYWWKLDYLPIVEKLPITYQLKQNQVYVKYSDAYQKRTFWLEDLQYQYEVKKLDNVYYFSDLGKEDFVDSTFTQFGFANTFSRAKLRMTSLSAHASSNLQLPTQTYTSTLWNEYGNGGSTFKNGVHKEVFGTTTTTISYSGLGKIEDSSDTTLNREIGQDLSQAWTQSSGIYNKQNSKAQFQMVRQATGVENWTFGNGFTMENNTGTMTYTIPNPLPGSILVNYISTFKVVESTTQYTLSLILTTGDSISFKVNKDFSAVEQVSTNSWVLNSEGYYTCSVANTDVQKNLELYKVGKNFYFVYNSMLSSNEVAKQKKFVLGFIHPYFRDVIKEPNSYYFDYFLNGTIISQDQRQASDIKVGVHQTGGDAVIYGSNYLVNIDFAQQKGTGTYVNDTQLSFIENYLTKEVSYIKVGEWTRTDKIDDTKAVLDSTTVYQVINNLVTKKFQNFVDPFTQYTFVNNTVKTVFPNGNINLLYSNGTKYLMTPNNGSYDIEIQITPDLNDIYHIYLNGTVMYKDRIGISTDYQVKEQLYIGQNLKVDEYILKPDQSKENLVITYYYESSNLELEKSVTIGNNVTYYFDNGDVKILNNLGSYNRLFHSKNNYFHYIKEETYNSLIESNVSQNQKKDYTIQFYNNGDINEIFRQPSNYEYYQSINGTQRTTNYDNNTILFKYQNSGLTSPTNYWNSQQIFFLDDNLTKIQKVVKVAYNDAVFTDFFFQNMQDTQTQQLKTIQYANNTFVSINNSTLTRTSTYGFNTTSYITQLDGTVERINLMKNYSGQISIKEVEDWQRDIQITFDDQSSIEIHPDVYIFTGCWYINDICARQRCYKEQKCNCNQNQYCEWNGSRNVCVDQGNNCRPCVGCSQCSSLNKYCVKDKKNNSFFFKCQDTPQESAQTFSCNCDFDQYCEFNYVSQQNQCKSNQSALACKTCKQQYRYCHKETSSLGVVTYECKDTQQITAQRENKCECAFNQYCQFNSTTKQNECKSDQATGSCLTCANQFQYCRKHHTTGVFSCSTVQEKRPAGSNYCGCESDEICINGVCNFKGIPCRYEQGKFAVFCGYDEKCVDSVCVKTCKPDCQPHQTCVSTSTGSTCVNKREQFSFKKLSCTSIQNCEFSLQSSKCEKCIQNHSFIRDLNYNTFEYPEHINRKICVLSVANCQVAKLQDSSYICENYQEMNGNFGSSQYEHIAQELGCNPGFIYQGGNCISRNPTCKQTNEQGFCDYCETLYETYSESYAISQMFSIYNKYDSGQCKPIPETPAELSEDFENKVERHKCSRFQFTFKDLSTHANVYIKYRQGEEICLYCQEGYYLNNQKFCIQKSIPFCETYDLTVPFGGTLVCLSCEIGSERLGNLCEQNLPTNPLELIPKCLKYSKEVGTNGFIYNCLQCEQDYERTTIEQNLFGQTIFCFEMPKLEKCLKVDGIQFFEQGQVSCNVCESDATSFTYPLTLIESKFLNTCINMPLKDKCQLYSFVDIQRQNFTCTKCLEEYYLKDQPNSEPICFLRANLVGGCLKYYVAKDECEVYEKTQQSTGEIDVVEQKLDEEFLLKNPPPSALEIVDEPIDPNWIMGCEVYLNEGNCYRCYAPKKINKLGQTYNDKCILVHREIQHCRYYDEFDKCIECNKYYFLRNHSCLMNTTLNCKVQLNEKTCSQCLDSYPFVNIDGKCAKHPSNPWCLTYIPSSEQLSFDDFADCDTCNKGFYPNNDGLCVLVTKPISYCVYYVSEKLCKQCEPGFYLSYDGKTCFVNPEWDKNCQDFTYQTTCSICYENYYLKEGQCHLCSVADEGCAYCDSEKTNHCLICRFGYSMGTDRKCTKNSDYNAQNYPTNFVILETFDPTRKRNTKTNLNYLGRLFAQCLLLWNLFQ